MNQQQQQAADDDLIITVTPTCSSHTRAGPDLQNMRNKI